MQILPIATDNPLIWYFNMDEIPYPNSLQLCCHPLITDSRPGAMTLRLCTDDIHSVTLVYDTNSKLLSEPSLVPIERYYHPDEITGVHEQPISYSLSSEPLRYVRIMFAREPIAPFWLKN